MAENIPASDKDFSGRLKTLIISFILFTSLLFGVFFAFLIAKVFDSSEAKQWETRFETIGDRLKKHGLQAKAIEQYKKFLNQPDIDMKKRALISFNVGELYMKSGKCSEALVWFFQTEIAEANFPQKEKLNLNIKKCLENISHEN